MPNELRELVWRRLGHRDLCAASAVCRHWNDEIKRTPLAWRLGAAPLGGQPTNAPELLQALLAACPELGQDLEWFEWRSLPIRVRLFHLRVSEFAFVQALRLSLSAATRASRRGDHENDDNRATKDEGLPAAEATKAQFQALISRMTDLPNPHPTARVTFRPAIMSALAEQLLTASEADAPTLHALCQSLLPLLTHQHQVNDMKSHLGDKLQVREELVEAQYGRAPWAIRLRVVSVGSQQIEERWPICFLGHWPRPLWPILLKLVNEGEVDTQLVAGLISHWTVTLEWPSAGGTSRTIRLTLNQYALLSVLSNTKGGGGGMTVSDVARALMIPAAYAWVVAESLAGLVAVVSAALPSRLGAFYDSRSLLITNQELADIAPGTELNFADREVRLRGKYLKLEITPAEEAALAEAQKLGARLLATLPAGSITTAPGFHVTGFALGFRCIRRCHCCYSCRVCERSIYELCPHCANDGHEDKKRLAEACWMVSHPALYHLHCFARNRAEVIPPGKTLSAAQQEVLERLAREPLPDGGHLSAPTAAAIAAARPQVGHHSYTHLKEASLFSLEMALANRWQQLLRKERDSAAAADTVEASQRD